jgi:phage terminase large subunit GpA-like protein
LGQDARENKPLRRLEFFWLCEHCAENMTLIFDKESGVSVRQKNYARAAAVA